MTTIAQSVFRSSEFGVEATLPRAGTTLENPTVYDDAAREVQAMADAGFVEIVETTMREVDGEKLIHRLTFKRLK